MSNLFSPLTLPGGILPNRIALAPMTRGRAHIDGTPSAPMVTYYANRADAGLLITEGVCVSPRALGWNGAPSLYLPDHVDGWRAVTDAVHARGGRIYAQLWFLGRVSHPVFLNGELPWGPTAIRANHHVHGPDGQREDCVVPHAMTLHDIRTAVLDFANSAQLAIEAGFDGVQLHAANGYLIDQFLRDSSNKRTDEYGGAVRNRLRFLLEVVEACAARIGSHRVAVRLSTRNTYNDIDDSDPATLFPAAAEALNDYGLSFLEVVEGLPGHFLHQPGEAILPLMRAAFAGVLMANGGYVLKSCHVVIRSKLADAVSFGVPFIANPDLVARFRQGAPLDAPNPETFYSQGEPGYNDYPFMRDSRGTAREYAPLSLDDARKH